LRCVACTKCGNVQQFSPVTELENVFRPLIFVARFEPDLIPIGGAAKTIFRFTNPSNEVMHCLTYQFNEIGVRKYDPALSIPPLSTDKKISPRKPLDVYIKGATESSKHKVKITITYTVGDDPKIHEVTGVAQLDVK